MGRKEGGRTDRNLTSRKTAHAVIFWSTTPIRANAALRGSESAAVSTRPPMTRQSTIIVTLSGRDKRLTKYLAVSTSEKLTDSKVDRFVGQLW